MCVVSEHEQKLIRRCQRGDIRAFKEVYERFNQPLLRTGLSMLGNQEDAEDAVQMVFIRLYRSIPQFQFQSKFSTYLYRIMVNVCLDMKKKKNKDRTVTEATSEPVYVPAYDVRIQVQQAIAVLPDRMRTCFVLFAVADMKQTDIADLMELSLGAVKAHIFQAKARLQNLLSDSHTEVNP